MSGSVRQPIDGDLVARHRDILATIAHLGGEANRKEIQRHLSDLYGLPERELVDEGAIYTAMGILEDRAYIETRPAADTEDGLKHYLLTEQAEEQLWSIGQYYNLFGELNGGGSE